VEQRGRRRCGSRRVQRCAGSSEVRVEDVLFLSSGASPPSKPCVRVIYFETVNDTTIPIIILPVQGCIAFSAKAAAAAAALRPFYSANKQLQRIVNHADRCSTSLADQLHNTVRLPV